MLKRLALLVVVLSVALGLGSVPAHAACYEQRTFTGREGGVYDVPGGQEKARWFNGDKINVHATWNSSWIGGNVYRRQLDGTFTFVATGYVLKQYTAFNRWIC